MTYFDLNCMLGPTPGREPGFPTAAALLAEMDRAGIAEALVYSSLARYAHPEDGNLRVLDDTRGHDRLHPCWVLLPPGNDEQPPPDELVRQMRAHGVRAARLYPEAHRFPLLECTLRPLLRALAGAAIPLLIDTGRAAWSEIRLDWREVFEIASRHPRLPLVLLREGGTTARVLHGVWHQHPNLFLEASYLQEARSIEETVHRFGADRLLFGTGMPAYDPGGPLAHVEGAVLDEEARAAIAGNNARALLGLPQTPIIHQNNERTPPAQAGRGRPARSWPCGPAGFRVFDIHGHLGRWGDKYYRDATAAEMVERMDQVGVERFAVSDILAIGPDYRAGNDRVGRAVAEFPDRIVGYAVYNPNHPADMPDEMCRCFDDLGCRGVKLHCGLHETSTEDPAYRGAFRFAQERACPVLCHGYLGPSPRFLREMLPDHPAMKFLYAHVGGGSRDGLRPLLEVANACPNLYFDLGSSGMPRGVLPWLVEQVPPAQILYGSDHPLNEFTFQLGRVLYADIPDTLKRRILWENACHVFGE